MIDLAVEQFHGENHAHIGRQRRDFQQCFRALLVARHVGRPVPLAGKTDEDRDLPLLRLGDVGAEFLLDPFRILAAVEAVIQRGVAVLSAEREAVLPNEGPE